MRRSLRPSAYARMVLNEFASSESAFVDLSAWDACVLPSLAPLREDKRLHIWVGVDASVKRDSTALVACTYNKRAKCVRLVAHRTFMPTPQDPIDFEATVEATILDWRERFVLRKVYFDPFQMVSVAQRLRRAGGVKIEEFAQTVPNLTAATQNLYDLIQSRSIALYPDAPMRLAISRAIMHESSRGWRLDKLKQAHKIDTVVALSIAALAAVRSQSESSYLSDLSWVSGPIENAEADYLEQRLTAHVLRYGGGGYYNARRW
jgi:phage terminase large subunit-like protein